jgi:hypothetical protein
MTFIKGISKRAGQWALPVLFLAVLVLPGCDVDEVLNLFKPEAKEFHHLAGVPSVEPANASQMSHQEKLGFYRWLVTEMETQVYARTVIDPNDVAGWVNVLAQQGSIEGVYHGLVYSTDYGTLQQIKKPADVKALRFFSTEMALMDFPAGGRHDNEVQAAAAKYVQDNINTSIYTLKQVLGERILKEAVKNKGNEDNLAAWYSGIVARWAKLDIPFGLAQRNNKDEVFHFNWAKTNTLGMLEWELLNREHRILNQFGGIAVEPRAQAKKTNPAGK